LAGAALTAAVVTVGAAATACFFFFLAAADSFLAFLAGGCSELPSLRRLPLAISPRDLLLEARNELGGASARVGRGLIRELLNVRLLRAVNPEKQRKQPSDEALSSLEIAGISVDSPHDRLVVRAEGAPRRAVLMVSDNESPEPHAERDDGEAVTWPRD